MESNWLMSVSDVGLNNSWAETFGSDRSRIYRAAQSLGNPLVFVLQSDFSPARPLILDLSIGGDQLWLKTFDFPSPRPDLPFPYGFATVPDQLA